MSLLARRSAFVLASLLVCWHHAQAADRFAGTDEYIRAALNTWEVPGLTIAVVKDGETVLSRSYGVVQRGKPTRVDLQTAFPIASCAKSMVAASLAMLVEQGQLHWDDPVAKHLPEFELSEHYLTEHLTLRDLLCHRTGLQRCDLLTDHTEPAEVLRRLKYIPAAVQPRTTLTYSNPMNMVLREVVQRVSSQSWEQFVAARIFEPLEMSKTTADVSGVANERIALRHWRPEGNVIARPDPDRGIHSTIHDMTNWLKLQLAGGKFQDRRLLKTETIGEMQALHFSVPISQRPTNVYSARFYGSGLGWFVQDYRGRKVVLHGGSWGAMVAMIPAERLGVVVLSNLDLSSLPALLMYDVFDAYLVGPEVAWNRDRWAGTWLKNLPPGHAYHPRDRARARLQQDRQSGTKPSLPLERYAGTYRSKLYGPLVVRHTGGQLQVSYAEFTTPAVHWEKDAFYVRAPTRLTFDWLLRFGLSQQSTTVTDLTVKHVGWDQTERDHVFVRDS